MVDGTSPVMFVLELTGTLSIEGTVNGTSPVMFVPELTGVLAGTLAMPESCTVGGVVRALALFWKLGMLNTGFLQRLQVFLQSCWNSGFVRHQCSVTLLRASSAIALQRVWRSSQGPVWIFGERVSGTVQRLHDFLQSSWKERLVLQYSLVTLLRLSIAWQRE